MTCETLSRSEIIQIVKDHFTDLRNVNSEKAFHDLFTYEYKTHLDTYYNLVHPQPEDKDFSGYTRVTQSLMNDEERYLKKKGYWGNFRWIWDMIKRDKELRRLLGKYHIVAEFVTGESEETGESKCFIIEAENGKFIVINGWWEKVRWFLQKQGE